MPLKAKNNVNKKRKAKEKIYKKNTKISLCHLQFYIRRENRSSIYFLQRCCEKKKSYIKVEYNHNDKARSMTYWKKKKLKA